MALISNIPAHTDQLCHDCRYRNLARWHDSKQRQRLHSTPLQPSARIDVPGRSLELTEANIELAFSLFSPMCRVGSTYLPELIVGHPIHWRLAAEYPHRFYKSR